MANRLNTRETYRLGYLDLQNMDGTLKTNVLSDVSIFGLAPVLKNPFCQYAFVKRIQLEVTALNLRDPQAVMYSHAISKLVSMGYYCKPAPQGWKNKIHFYCDFLKLL